MDADEDSSAGSRDRRTRANVFPKAILVAMRQATDASCGVISRALITHDPEAIWRELHALCGGLLSLGSVELAELCKGLQHVLREEGIEVFAGLWPALRAELMETLDALPADLDDDVSS